MLYKNVKADLLSVDERELSRRLGSPDVKEYASMPQWARLSDVLDPSYSAERVPLKRSEGGIYIGECFTASSGFRKAAEGADECYVMACTLGLGVDKLIAKEQSISTYGAFVTDAMADALIEALADFAEREICDGLIISPRFSPGYADLELRVGTDIVLLLGAGVRQGIRFTESGLMVPRKSITAIIPIKRNGKCEK